MYIQPFETERLLLRPMTHADAPAAFVWCSDALVNRYMTYPLYTDVEEVRTWLTRMEADEGILLCGIERREDGLLIGSISLSRKPDTTALNLGYNLRRDCWVQGYATEAARALLGHAYALGYRDFIACHAAENIGSAKVIARCGFTFDHDDEYSKYDGSVAFPARYYTLHLD